MSAPKYHRGDMVRIADNNGTQFGGHLVIISKVEALKGGLFNYDFVIPERRGSVPESLIDTFILGGFEGALPKE